MGDVVPKKKRKTRESGVPHYLYALANGEYTKIGVTFDVTSRIHGLQTGSPQKIVERFRLEYESEDNARLAEVCLHKYFDTVKKLGEWYLIDRVFLRQDVFLDIVDGNFVTGYTKDKWGLTITGDSSDEEYRSFDCGDCYLYLSWASEEALRGFEKIQSEDRGFYVTAPRCLFLTPDEVDD